MLPSTNNRTTLLFDKYHIDYSNFGPDPDYIIGSTKYNALASLSYFLMSNGYWEDWTTMLDSDATFYFPQGLDNDRMHVSGASDIVAWWQQWFQNSKLQSMTFSKNNSVPIFVPKALQYTPLIGNWVFSWMDCVMTFPQGQLGMRVNCTVHFNDNDLIDAYFTYFDQTLVENFIL